MTHTPRPPDAPPRCHLAAAISAGSARDSLGAHLAKGGGVEGIAPRSHSNYPTRHHAVTSLLPLVPDPNVAVLELASSTSAQTAARPQRAAFVPFPPLTAGSDRLRRQIWSPPTTMHHPQSDLASKKSRTTNQHKEEEPHRHHPCGPLRLR
jgi:hypothetical protein